MMSRRDKLQSHSDTVWHQTSPHSSMYDESGCHRTLFCGTSVKFDMPKFKRSWAIKQEIPPDILSEREANEILEADSLSIRRKVFLYEALIDKHQHPFFILRLANVLFTLDSPTMAMHLCVKVCFFSISAVVINPLSMKCRLNNLRNALVISIHNWMNLLWRSHQL